MAEFEGTWDLIEAKDIRIVASCALTNMLNKITFHSGIIEDSLFDVFAQTKCQIDIKVDVPPTPPPINNQNTVTNSYVGLWAKKSKTIQNRDPRDSANINFCLMFDKNNPSPHPSIRNCDKANGLIMKTRFKLGEEFNVTIPITCEKVPCKVSRSSKNSIVQLINFASGPLEVSYTLNKDQMMLDFFHVPTSKYANLLFMKHQEPNQPNNVTATKKTQSGKKTSRTAVNN